MITMSRYYVLWIFIYLSVQFLIMTTKGCAQLFEKKLKKINQRQACQTEKWAMYACADQLLEMKSDAKL